VSPNRAQAIHTLQIIVDQHFPAYTASVGDRRLSPWFNDECRASPRRTRNPTVLYQKASSDIFLRFHFAN